MEEQRDEALEQYFEAMKQLSEYPPFRIWLGELAEQSTNIDSIQQAKNNEDLFFRKGQMDIINLNLNLRENIDMLEGDYLKSLEPDDAGESPEGLYQS